MKGTRDKGREKREKERGTNRVKELKSFIGVMNVNKKKKVIPQRN